MKDPLVNAFLEGSKTALLHMQRHIEDCLAALPQFAEAYEKATTEKTEEKEGTK